MPRSFSVDPFAPLRSALRPARPAGTEPAPRAGRTRRRGPLPGIGLLVALFLSVPHLIGCEADPPAMAVGELRFSQDEVRGLSPTQLQRLARIGAVGLAVRDESRLDLGRPLLDLQVQDALLARLREELVLDWADVDDEVLEAQYRTRPEWELEVRHLVRLSERWRPEEHRRQAEREARAALERLDAGEPFPRVAAEFSEEPGAAERGGLLEPGREGTWVTEFWTAARDLDVGEVSDVVETEYGFHVLKLEDRREVPFPEARPRLASEVAAMVGGRGRWEDWVDERRDEIRVDVEPLPPSGLPDDDDPSIVATWDGGELSAGDLAWRLAGLRADTVAAFAAGEPDLREAVVLDAALSARLIEEAEERDIQLSDPRLAGIERAWERTVDQWAAVFGFEPGMPLGDLRARALEALTGTGQNLQIARGEVDRRGPALDRAYPITLPGS